MEARVKRMREEVKGLVKVRDDYMVDNFTVVSACLTVI